ncbi:hypothetical protein [Chitinophaga silvatica]|uniref:hypothetical protein n=1 Tax=Chitinophaga silvatica TaxID=2282649 RepID=UPI0011C1CDBA|nr:hypothetical protein [Chitinophaga silvatica]
MKILALLLMGIILFSCAHQQVIYASKFGIEGKYQKENGKELLIFNADKTFYCLRNYIPANDVLIPMCDTIASGIWNQRAGFIELHNKPDFNKINYSIVESLRGTKDSVYFRIILPKDDALDYKNFVFNLIPYSKYDQVLKINKPEFAIPNVRIPRINFGLSLQNIEPNVDFGKGNFQRTNFMIFENYQAKDNNANFFTITLNNFNQCFYEAMDMEGQIIGIEGKKLVWRGNRYEKIN